MAFWKVLLIKTMTTAISYSSRITVNMGQQYISCLLENDEIHTVMPLNELE